jgi:hypothetical protein
MVKVIYIGGPKHNKKETAKNFTERPGDIGF